MMMRSVRSVIVLELLGYLCVSVASPPTIGATPKLKLRKDVSTDATSLFIDVTDTDGDSFTCRTDHIVQTLPFHVMLTAGTKGYLLTISHSNPSALTASQYVIKVQCTDVNSESATADVIVSISNNSPPTATTSRFETVTVDVAKLYSQRTVLHTVLATDPDGDPVTCTATSVSVEFTVDKNDCTIRNVRDLRYLTFTSSEVIDINVSDGLNTAVAFRRVLSFVNQNKAPVFKPLPSILKEPEDVTSSTILVTFDVTDEQPFSRSFSVDTGASLFDFDPSTGIVKLAAGKSFDYESGPRAFVITCVADDSFFKSTSTVTVSIVDVNEAPSLTPTSVGITVPEGGPSSVAATLPLTVKDEDDAITPTSHTFSVVPGGAFSQFFTFPDPHKLVLTNLRELDKEGSLPSPLSLDVAVRDKGGKSATARVVMTLTDVNDNAPVFEPSSLVMSEVYVGMGAGSVLGKVKATDKDEGTNQNVEFSLGTASPDAALFRVLSDGTVSLAKTLAQPHGTALTLEVKATDKGSPAKSTSAVLTFAWNKAPQFVNLPGIADVPEDPSVEKLLLTLKTSDPENDTASCSVIDVTPKFTGPPPFVVKTVTGTTDQGVYYTGGQDLARAVSASYEVRVRAEDGKGGSSAGVLKVQLTANTPPTSSCVGSDSATLDVKTAKLNDVVKSLVVSDAENDDITFGMTSTPNSGSFRFNSGSRQVEVARDLQREAATLHILLITISDNKNPALSCTLYLTLLNVNVPPKFASHQATVPVNEHVTPLTSLFQFTVTDVSTFNVRWEVSPLNESSYFTFDDKTKEVKVASGQSFDYETKRREFLITCVASNAYVQSSSSVTISVFDTSDPPYFLSSSVTANVNEGPGGTVSFIPPYGVVDPDGDTLTYQVVEGGNFSSHFSINTATGKLTNALTLDRDDGAPNPISIQVSVTDPSGLSATSDVIIFLNDVNDHSPEFAQASYSFKVGLSTKKGTLLGNITVTDKDEGSNAQLSLVITKANPIGYMRLEQDGRLYLTSDASDVDYGTLFSLEVKATDQGNPPRFATAVVDVVWNEGPKIRNLPSTLFLSEALAGRHVLFDLEVEDAESDQFTCALQDVLPRPAQDAFFTVMDTAVHNFSVIFTGAGQLSSSDTRKYTLTITCRDTNSKVTKDLTVNVLPNTAPVLTCSPSAKITVDGLTTAADQTVYTIVANDRENDSLEYSLASPAFYVGKYSGVIKATKSLRTASTDQFSLPISVTDKKHTAECTLNVFLDTANAAPYFSNLDYTVDIPENTAPGSAVYVISVVDPNIFGVNIGMTWNAVGRSQFKFNVNVAGLTATVKLSAGQTLDYETEEDRTLTLTFVASDGYLTSEEKTLTVRVTPVNEPPYFGNNVLHFYATFREFSQPPQVDSLNCNVADPDADDKVTLTLSGTHASFFSIADLSNCQMSLTAEYDLDGGAADKVTLKLIATDKLGATAEATVTVTITPTNDNTPQFSGPLLLRVGPSMRAGQEVGRAEATDKDVGKDGVMTYEVVTEPEDAQLAHQYLTFSSTGHFILRQPMDNFMSTENFRYVIRVKDGGDTPLTSTTTVNVVYDRTLTTTTPASNDTIITATTPTTVAPTTTAVSATGSPEDDSLLEQPLVIGMLVALCCVGAVLVSLALLFCLKSSGLCSSSSSSCFNKSPEERPSSPNSLYSSPRSHSPLRTNKISVVTMDTNSGYVGRKISAILPLPPAHY